MAKNSQKNNLFSPLHISIIFPVLATAGAHLYLGLFTHEELRNLFILNGLGYLGLLVLFLAPQLQKYHAVLRWILAGFTFVTLLAWVYFAQPFKGYIDPFDAMVKFTEITLIVELFLDMKAEKA